MRNASRSVSDSCPPCRNARAHTRVSLKPTPNEARSVCEVRRLTMECHRPTDPAGSSSHALPETECRLPTDPAGSSSHALPASECRLPTDPAESASHALPATEYRQHMNLAGSSSHARPESG